MAAVTTSVPKWMNPIVRTVVNRGKNVINARELGIYGVAKRFASDISRLSPQIQAEAIKGLVPEQRAWVIGGMGDAETLNPEVLVNMGPEAFGNALSYMPALPAERSLEALVGTGQYEFLAAAFPFVNLDNHFNGIGDARFFKFPYADDSESRVPVLSNIANDNSLAAISGKLSLFGYFQFKPLIDRAPAIAEILASAGGDLSKSLNAGLLQMPKKTAVSIVSSISAPAQMSLFRNWGKDLYNRGYSQSEIARDREISKAGMDIINKIPALKARVRSGDLQPSSFRLR